MYTPTKKQEDINSALLNQMKKLINNPDHHTTNILDFIDKCCLVSKYRHEVNKDLYDAYCDWSKKHHCEILGKKKFGERLGEMNLYTSYHYNKYCRDGLELRNKIIPKDWTNR